jgi:hypothetical protein
MVPTTTPVPSTPRSHAASALILSIFPLPLLFGDYPLLQISADIGIAVLFMHILLYILASVNL